MSSGRHGDVTMNCDVKSDICVARALGTYNLFSEQTIVERFTAKSDDIMARFGAYFLDKLTKRTVASTKLAHGLS